MSDHKIFLDTNIIIYAYDVSAEPKHKIAKDLMIDLWESGLGVISTQVLQEFYVNVTQKIQAPLEMNLAKSIIEDLLTWDVVINDGESLLGAVDIQIKYKTNFWDSLIIQAASQGGAKFLYTEDFQDGQNIEDVRIKNPFANPKDKS